MSGRASILYRKQVRKILDAFRADGCLACGEKQQVCLSAHHKDPTKKSFGISHAISELRVTPERIRTELAKCCCLCLNCHAKLEAGLIVLPYEREAEDTPVAKPDIRPPTEEEIINALYEEQQRLRLRRRTG